MLSGISTSSSVSSSSSPWSASCTAATPSRGSGSSPSSPAPWPLSSPTGAGTSTSSTQAWSTRSRSRRQARLEASSPSSTSSSSSPSSSSTDPWSSLPTTLQASRAAPAQGAVPTSNGSHLPNTTKVLKERDIFKTKLSARSYYTRGCFLNCSELQSSDADILGRRAGGSAGASDNVEMCQTGTCKKVAFARDRV